jgi:N-acetylmuramoyl-L-alanine amidase
MREINKIIIHCSATPEQRHVDVQTIRDWHLKRGWSDIGYHFVVYLDGTVVPGRPVERIGAHVKGMNRNSIGVCYIGGVDYYGKPKDTRTQEQLDSLEQLITDLFHQYPEASLHGHNEFSTKACPSFDVQDEYGYLIECYGKR